MLIIFIDFLILFIFLSDFNCHSDFVLEVLMNSTLLFDGYLEDRFIMDDFFFLYCRIQTDLISCEVFRGVWRVGAGTVGCISLQMMLKYASYSRV